LGMKLELIPFLFFLPFVINVSFDYRFGE
jgi:hypothetical protein